MQLQCLMPHMAGQTIVVEGSEYHIDEDGLCSNLSAAHGERLLGQFGAWARVGEAGPLDPEDAAMDAQYVATPDSALQLPDGLELTLPPRLKTVAPVRKKRGRYSQPAQEP